MLGLYVHVPFCFQKCNYCDFYSEDDKNYLINDYIEALIKELKKYKSEFNFCFDTLYIGGGTPTSLSEKFLDYIFSGIFSIYPRTSFKEITIEVNPDTINEKKAKVLSLNVTRVSVGAQSFNDNFLKLLNRIHDSESVKRAVEILSEWGIENINLDIMIGIPGQGLNDVFIDIKKAIELKPQHISFYILTPYPETQFLEKYSKNLPNDDLIEKMYLGGVDLLQKNGFMQYEISNFSIPGKECIHNLNYWNLGEYIGIGASASSFFNNKRYTNIKSIEGYIEMIRKNKTPIYFEEEITADKRLKEYIILKLRTTTGIKLEEFYDKFKFNFVEKYSNIIDKLTRDGYMRKTIDKISLTTKGFLVSNKILQQFI
ncbi:MAG: radical SAM family heme chaperone HemW [Candidatus Goldbacteria bacterium]|nr:radical SAM family heme chaperone HemW [Candidatus Goldiibacteriota bacterium]